MAVSRATRAFIHARDEGRCQGTLIGGECGNKLTIHHLLPREEGGSNRRSNLLLVCRDHHNRIHNPRYRDAAIEYGLLRQVAEPPLVIKGKITREQCEALGLPWGVPNAKRKRMRLIASGALAIPDDMVRRARPLPPPPPSWPPVPTVPLPAGLRSWTCERCTTVTLAAERPALCPECWWPPGAESWVDADGVEFALTPRGARAVRPVHLPHPDERLMT